MQIRRKAACPSGFRMIARRLVGGQVVSKKLSKTSNCGVSPPCECVDRLCAPVEFAEAFGYITVDRKARQWFSWTPFVLRRQLRGRNKVFRQLRIQARSEMMQHKRRPSEHARGHNHIRIHGPERKLQAFRLHTPPALWFATRILIADEKRRLPLFKECFERVIGRSTKDKAHSAFRRIFSHIAQSLGHKVV